MSHSATRTSQLIELWLHERSPNTKEYYRRVVKRFLAHADKPLEEVTLMDIQMWQLSLSSLAPASQRTALAAIKSLFSFGHQLGVLPFNVGKLARSPKIKENLAEKILTMAQVQLMLTMETNLRNRAILRLLYSGGLRVSELCDLKWLDLKARDAGGQVTVFGKGRKTRVVLLGERVWEELTQLQGNAEPEEPVFRSRKRNQDGSYHLTRKQVYRIVQAAGKRAGIRGKVSPHWLRHSHASHSLDQGAPLHLVQQTLGHSSIAVTERYLHAKPDDSSALYLD
jgi:integrase/recombinase XerD